jgi:hypothetical protein
MKYSITAVKRTQIPKRDGSGTWTKVQIKTNKTGDEVLELGFGHQPKVKDNLKAGDVVIGYVEKAPWNKSDGTPGGFNVKLNGLTPEYLYQLILKIAPGVEGIEAAPSAPQATDSEWETTAVDAGSPEDPGF